VSKHKEVALAVSTLNEFTLENVTAALSVAANSNCCVQKSDDSRFCNSHCLSHFAAFFIVVGT